MRVLLTAGPTREYLDDVRYLSNASSGRMGYALAEAGRDAGWEVTLVSGPVEIPPPRGIDRVDVLTTDQMRTACERAFDRCDGVIAAAAVCDYRPKSRVDGKIAKTGAPVTIEMIETDDVLAGLGARKGRRWVVGFALEAQNPRENALQKLRRKNCDLILLNNPAAIGSDRNEVEVLADPDQTVACFAGSKPEVAASLVDLIQTRFGSETTA